MIGVKGAQQTEESGISGEAYAFKNAQGASRIPLFIAMVITGIAAYVKTAFGPPAQPLAEDPAPLEASERVAYLMPEPIGTAKLDNLEDYNEKSDTANFAARMQPVAQHSIHRYGGNVVEFPRPHYVLVDSKPLSFTEPVEMSNAALPSHGFTAAPRSNSSGGGTSTPAAEPKPPVAGSDAEPEEPDEPAPSAKRNRAPQVTGPVRLNDAMTGTAVLIGLSELLANASDPDGDPLSVKNVRISSGAIGSDEGAWVYSSNAQASPTEVRITYEITDGSAVVAQTAILDIDRGAPLLGTGGGDALLGSLFGDSILALGGGDLVDARAGDDVVFGGDGDDQIVAGEGHDIVFAGGGNDVVFGGAGNDLVSGGEGDDRLFGDEGDDTVLGEAGDDVVDGGDGNDFAAGGEGDDIVAGGAGDDTVAGGEGNDELTDGAGNDRVFGDAGDDVVRVTADTDDDVFEGGEGTDTLELSELELGITMDLNTGLVTGIEVGVDTVGGFEIIVGTQADDRFEDGQGHHRIYAAGGDDVVIADAAADDDILDGGTGRDTLDFSETTGGINVDLKTGQVTGVEVGTDTISNFETILGGDGADFFQVGASAVTLGGGGGDDTFSFDLPAAAGAEDHQRLVHEVIDFLVGDRILVAEYEFSSLRRDDSDDRFEFYYRDRENPDEELRLRVRYEEEDGQEFTLFEFNYDGDSEFELTIAIRGHQEPSIYERPIADIA